MRPLRNWAYSSIPVECFLHAVEFFDAAAGVGMRRLDLESIGHRFTSSTETGGANPNDVQEIGRLNRKRAAHKTVCGLAARAE